jgi:hypothetical protein
MNPSRSIALLAALKLRDAGRAERMLTPHVVRASGRLFHRSPIIFHGR